MHLSAFLCALLFLFSCSNKSGDSAKPKSVIKPTYLQSELTYKYDRQSGLCLNKERKKGWNQDHVGECGLLEGKDLSNQKLSLKSFRGARLKGAKLNGTDVSESDFRGADLTDIDYVGLVGKGALFNDDTKLTSITPENFGFVKKPFSATDWEFLDMIRSSTSTPEKLLESTKKFIIWGADVDFYLGQALLETAQVKTLETFKLLLAAGADPNGRSNRLPLNRAIIWSCRPCIDQLLAYGADINALEDGRDSPLLTSLTWNSDKTLIPFLLKRGAKINQTFSISKESYAGNTVGTVLTIAKDIDVIELLLQHGADIKYRYLLAEKTIADVLYFIKKGADVNQIEKEKLGQNLAMKFVNDFEGVKELLSRGLNINHKDRKGRSLLAYAIEAKDLSLASILIDSGIDVQAPGLLAQFISTMLDDYGVCHKEAYLTKFTGTALKILSKGANPNLGDRRGDNAAMALVRSFRFLKCYDSSAANKIQSLFSALKKAGSEINANSPWDKFSPLTLSAYRLEPKWVEILLKAGVDPNKDDGAGRLAVMASEVNYATQEYKEIIKQLIDAGADFRTTNRYGQDLGMIYLDTRGCFIKGGNPNNNFDLLVPRLDPEHKDNDGNGLVHYLSRSRKTYIYNEYSEGDKRELSIDLFLCFAEPLLGRYDFNVKNSKGETSLSMLLSGLKNLEVKFFSIDRFYKWLSRALTLGLDPNQKNGKGESLIELFARHYSIKGITTLIDHGGAMDLGAGSQPAPQTVQTPTNACPEELLARGWQKKNGGCQSPIGFVWSVASTMDSCETDRGEYRCWKAGATGKVNPATYCSVLRQGGREDWKTPGLLDYLHASLNGYFEQFTDLIFLQGTTPNSFKIVKAKDRELIEVNTNIDAYGFCVAK